MAQQIRRPTPKTPEGRVRVLDRAESIITGDELNLSVEYQQELLSRIAKLKQREGH